MNKIKIFEIYQKTKKIKKIRNEDESTIDEFIEKILKIKYLIENENNPINYEMVFD